MANKERKDEQEQEKRLREERARREKGGQNQERRPREQKSKKDRGDPRGTREKANVRGGTEREILEKGDKRRKSIK